MATLQPEVPVEPKAEQKVEIISLPAEQAEAFAEPILAAIADRPPDYQDAFSDPESGWPIGLDIYASWGYENGAYFIQVPPIRSITSGAPCIDSGSDIKPLFSDFVLEVEAQVGDYEWGTWHTCFRYLPETLEQLGPTFYCVDFSPDGVSNLYKNIDSAPTSLVQSPSISSFDFGTPNHLMIIAHGPQIAIYMNGEPVTLVYDEPSRRARISLELGACNGADVLIRVYFDNLKVWDITNLPLPTPAPRLGTVEAGDLLDDVLAAGKIVVSYDTNYAPQSFLNDAGELVGFDVDVAKEVAMRLGVKLEFITPDLIPAGSWARRWDLSIGSMPITEARNNVLLFTQPYYFTHAQVVVHVDNTDIQEVDDLAGKTVGVCGECTYEHWLRGTFTIVGEEVVFPGWEAGDIVAYETDLDAVIDLAEGDGDRLDAVISAKPMLLDAIASGCDGGCPFRLVGDPVFNEPTAFALDRRRGPSERMLERLNQILTDMHGDGTLTELSMKWYGVEYSKRAGVGEEK
jgi:polar amino acid transport system substrate-binding protein